LLCNIVRAISYNLKQKQTVVFDGCSFVAELIGPKDGAIFAVRNEYKRTSAVS